MKREQKAFAMLMAACMAFTGISSLMSASAAPLSFSQTQVGNYLDDGAKSEPSPAEVVLPSGKKVIKKTAASTTKKTKVVSKQQAAEIKTGKTAQSGQEQQVTVTKDGRRVIKAKKAAVQTKKEQPRASLSAAARG